MQFTVSALIVGWLLVLAHVVAFGASARARAPPGRLRFSGSLLAAAGAAVAVGTAVAACTVPLAVRTSRAPVCSDGGGVAFTLSRVTSESPWCATFAVGLALLAAGVHRALRGAGAPRCAAAVASQLLLVGALPDVGGGLAWAHSAALSALALSYAVSACSGALGGARALSVLRSHALLAAGAGAATAAISWKPHQAEGVERLACMLLETGALAHFAASFV